MKVSDEKAEFLIDNCGIGSAGDEVESMARELLAARRVVEAARAADGAVLIGLGEPQERGLRSVWMSGDHDHAGIFMALRAALSAYDEATR